MTKRKNEALVILVGIIEGLAWKLSNYIGMEEFTAINNNCLDVLLRLQPKKKRRRAK